MAVQTVRESSLWKWLKAVTAGTPAVHAHRIENRAAEGTPDVELCMHGASCWIELKVARPMADDLLNVLVSPAQVEWHRRRAMSGGRSWLLVKVDTGGNARRYLLPGSWGSKLTGGERVLEEWLCARAACPGDTPADRLIAVACGRLT